MANPSIEMLIDEAWAGAHALFYNKMADYGEPPFDLGAAGQYSDMHRKMRKLKRALWDGQTLTGEQPLEICQDLMGHLALTIAFLRHEEQQGKRDSGGIPTAVAKQGAQNLVHWQGQTHLGLASTNVTAHKSFVNCPACLVEMDR